MEFKEGQIVKYKGNNHQVNNYKITKVWGGFFDLELVDEVENIYKLLAYKIYWSVPYQELLEVNYNKSTNKIN